MMNTTHTITVDIDPQGQSVITVDGVTGPACVDVTKQVEKALGAVSTRRKTADYHKEPHAHVTAKHSS